MDTNDEVVMYLVFRADLNLPKGKIAAQAGHAVQLVIREVENAAEINSNALLHEWEKGSYTKIALKVADEASLRALHSVLCAANVLCVPVVDEGRTVVTEGTMTVLGIQPLSRSKVAPFVHGLKLL